MLATNAARSLWTEHNVIANCLSMLRGVNLESEQQIEKKILYTECPIYREQRLASSEDLKEYLRENCSQDRFKITNDTYNIRFDKIFTRDVIINFETCSTTYDTMILKFPQELRIPRGFKLTLSCNLPFKYLFSLRNENNIAFNNENKNRFEIYFCDLLFKSEHERRARETKYIS